MKTISDWRHQFIALPHSIAGVPITDLTERLAKIEKSVSVETPGSLCILSEPDPLDFALRFFCMLDYGLIPIPVSPEMPEPQKNKLKGRLPEASSKNQFSSVYICMTSGTTSAPKFCYLSITGALANAKAHAQSFGFSEKTLIAQALPLYHSFGLVCYLWTSIAVGCSIDFNLMAPSLAVIAGRYDENAAIYLSPAQLRFFARQKQRPVPRIGIASIGGGAISANEVQTFAEVFPHSKRLVSYGLTEAGPRVSSGEAKKVSEGSSIGRAMPGIELYVRDENGQLLSKGEGLLCIRSPSLKLNLSSEELAAPGILLTRDNVVLRDQEISFLAREQDIIKVGGISVYPADIESAARSLSGVTDCIVLKIPDPLYEEVPILAAEGSISEEALEQHLQMNLAPSQMPKRVFVVPQLPRQSLNKIDRRELLKILGLS